MPLGHGAGTADHDNGGSLPCGGDASVLEQLVAGLDDLALKRRFGGLLAYAMRGGELFGR